MTEPLRIALPDLVTLIREHFAPLEVRVHFPGDFSRIDNIKVLDEQEQVRQHFTTDSDPAVDEVVSAILFGVQSGLIYDISEPDPDPAAEDQFYWELVSRFQIPPELPIDEWLDVPEGRRAWGEWTTWHDHTRIATIWPPR